ncbi:hypothetical protein [Lyngbya aestuarii]|uniref:hypothetical protein n=1 Tax=Lyngbya aestuarii TaxID=118322 RepID=UPI00403DDCA3
MVFLEVPRTEVIAGENAVRIAQLPPVWQEIARGEANVGMPNRQTYVEAAQLFQYKLENGDVDLFNERPELAHLKPSFSELFGQMARETLEFYGHDFQIENYPNFQAVLREFESKGIEYENQVKVVHIVRQLFEEFGYELPASFYYVYLSPVYQDNLFEERALRFDPRDAKHKRPWDAVLHAGKVFAIQMKLQSIASKHGFTYHHGCDCNKHLSSVDQSRGAFAYELRPEHRQRWIRSFVWTTWYEYALFPIVPNTRYLV